MGPLIVKARPAAVDGLMDVASRQKVHTEQRELRPEELFMNPFMMSGCISSLNRIVVL